MSAVGISLGSTEGSVDARLAELGVAHDLWHGAPIFPKRADLFDPLGGELRLGAEPRPPFFSLGYPVHLSLPPNVVLKLGNQREDSHNELACAGGRVDRRIVQDLEGNSFVGQERNNPVKIRG